MVQLRKNNEKGNFMYSEILKKEKLVIKNKKTTVGVDIQKSDLIKIIDSFCKKDDIIGVPTTKLFELFDSYCDENGFQKINHLTLGRVFREHFGVDRKKVRCGKKLHWVYVSIN